MKLFVTLALVLVLVLSSASLQADPVTGTYKSTDLGGQILTGRASTWRTGINSGLPHVMHIQSWDGATLGTQWEITCPVEDTPFDVQDNRDSTGTGTVVYTSHFHGGGFVFYTGGWPWGDGAGTLDETTMISTVQYVNNIPVASVVNGNTSGTFDDGALLVFAIGNGSGVGETTSLDPTITIPPDYPVFLDDTCNPAPPDKQFGTWGNVCCITVQIDATIATEPETWGSIKSMFK